MTNQKEEQNDLQIVFEAFQKSYIQDARDSDEDPAKYESIAFDEFERVITDYIFEFFEQNEGTYKNPDNFDSWFIMSQACTEATERIFKDNQDTYIECEEDKQIQDEYKRLSFKEFQEYLNKKILQYFEDSYNA